MRRFIRFWYYSYYFKNVSGIHAGVLLLIKLQAPLCNITKSKTPLWVLFTFFKLYKWYQIVQSVINEDPYTFIPHSKKPYLKCTSSKAKVKNDIAA